MNRRRPVQMAIVGMAKPKPVPVRLPPQPEKEFMAALIKYATLMGWRHFHDAATNAPRACWNCGRRSKAPRNPAGLPDLLLVRRPRVVWAELKADGEEPKPDQQAWLDDLAACGQEVFVWTPKSWDEIERVLGVRTQ